MSTIEKNHWRGLKKTKRWNFINLMILLIKDTKVSFVNKWRFCSNCNVFMGLRYALKNLSLNLQKYLWDTEVSFVFKWWVFIVFVWFFNNFKILRFKKV